MGLNGREEKRAAARLRCRVSGRSGLSKADGGCMTVRQRVQKKRGERIGVEERKQKACPSSGDVGKKGLQGRGDHDGAAVLCMPGRCMALRGQMRGRASRSNRRTGGAVRPAPDPRPRPPRTPRPESESARARLDVIAGRVRTWSAGCRANVCGHGSAYRTHAPGDDHAAPMRCL